MWIRRMVVFRSWGEKEDEVDFLREEIFSVSVFKRDLHPCPCQALSTQYHSYKKSVINLLSKEDFPII